MVGGADPRRHSRYPGAMTATAPAKLVDRWREVPPLAQGGAATVLAFAVYVIALRAPGIGPYMERKAPFAVIVVGLVTGTVTALLAIGLILIYRANRFINF